MSACLGIGYCYRNKIQTESLNQKTLYMSKEKTTTEKFFDVIQELFLLLLIIISVFVGVYVNSQENRIEFIQYFLLIYKQVFIVSVLPVIISKGAEIIKKGLEPWIWRMLFFVVICCTIIFYFDYSPDDIKKHIISIALCISIFLSLVIETICKVTIEYNNAHKKISRKNIRKDLYYRTSGIDIDISYSEMDRCCEKLFCDYIQSYYRLEKLEKIEFVHLLEKSYGEVCYKRVANVTRFFIAISALMSLLMIIKYKLPLGIILVIVGVYLIYVMIIYMFKKKAPICLKKIVIRFFYDEWGYYLVGKKKEKFVGRVQLLEGSSYHRYIHSFWNIAALCRAVAYRDRFSNEGTKKIKHISRELSQMFAEYVKPLKEKDWELFLPLWAVALFEYDVTGKINKECKKVLKTMYKEDNGAQINIFLQSFWFDDMRMESKRESSAYIKKFEKEIYKRYKCEKNSRITTGQR